jgi:hypothetical protein
MLLTIDIGNTNMVLGVFQEDTIVSKSASDTKVPRRRQRPSCRSQSRVPVPGAGRSGQTRHRPVPSPEDFGTGAAPAMNSARFTPSFLIAVHSR